MPQISDTKETKLLLAIAGGDESAFKKLVDDHWSSVYNHALAYVKVSETAQEITQDIFLQIWNKRAHLSEVENLKAFIFILGKNKIISAMRRNLAPGSISLSPQIDMMDNMLAPQLQLEYKQTYELIMQAIETLPQKRQQVFKMSRLEGLTHMQIAELLQISHHTVKEHIVLALNFVRTYLQLHGGKQYVWIALMFFSP